MKFLRVFSIITIFSYCCALPSNSDLFKKIKAMTGIDDHLREDWRKCEPGDTHVDGCGSCTCGPKNLFECTWEHCVGPVEHWDDIILPHEMMDHTEDNTIRIPIITLNISMPFFYSASKHKFAYASTDMAAKSSNPS